MLPVLILEHTDSWRHGVALEQLKSGRRSGLPEGKSLTMRRAPGHLTVETMGRFSDSRANPCTASVGTLVAAVALLAVGPASAAQPSQEGPGGSAAEEPGPSLELVNLDLLDSRDGYAIPPDSRYLPGERVHVYFQIKGYSVGEADRIHLRYEVVALDPDGRRFYAPASGEYDAELAPQDKNWMPVVRYSPRIPDHAGGGTYSVQIAVRDVLNGVSLDAKVPIHVDGEFVERADELLVRNFRFSRAENGDPLTDPEFRPGEQIWANFFITGFEIRENNTFNVESDAWVLDADGERLLSFQSSGEEGKPFYPRLWLPATMRLDLSTTVDPGLYTVVLRLRDRVAGAEATQRYSFTIR